MEIKDNNDKLKNLKKKTVIENEEKVYETRITSPPPDIEQKSG